MIISNDFCSYVRISVLFRNCSSISVVIVVIPSSEHRVVNDWTLCTLQSIFFLHIYGFSNVHQQNNHNNWFIYSIHILNQHKSYRTLLSAILNTGLYLHIILYIWIFPSYLLFYSIFDKIPINKHIYNNNQSLNVQNTCVNRRYSYRTLYPPFWIYERLPITFYISIKTYYLLFILLEIIRNISKTTNTTGIHH
jgi:hypothetical protein